jgi:hypothetical protein
MMWVLFTPSLSSCVLIRSSRCTFQPVSTAYSLVFVSCPYLSLSILSPVRECPLFSRFLSVPLTCPVQCALQTVSAARFLASCRCPQLSLLLRSPVQCQCSSLAFFVCPNLSIAVCTPGRECQCFALSLPSCVSYFPSPIPSPVRGCHLLAHLLSMPSLVAPDPLSRV